MISLHRSMHSSQMYTPGPAMSFLTCFWLFPQNEHFSRSPPSPMRAMVLGAYFLFTVLMVLSRVYFPTLPACSTAMRPIEVNRVGDIRVVRLNISPEAAPCSPERAAVSLACRARYATERQTN